MRFKTPKDSATGKKFALILEKKEQCWDAVQELKKEIGFTAWRPDRWAAWGGIEFVQFANDENPDPKIWKQSEAGFSIKRNTKKGKALHERFSNLPDVSVDQLNQCVGFDGAPFKTIGFSWTNTDYYLFSVGDDWKFTTPTDCIEITTSEFKKLSDASKNKKD